ncbi:hypothetical protein Bca52824_011104 [Brassica carinata]|uniref:Uncharacterized protein n=1 Tax=Brassica carinata TaxID=52824 RepID=A0A8X7WF56_BRACI|nr:hypothetical protein Bca52824_011104 [Brassica carinata]
MAVIVDRQITTATRSREATTSPEPWPCTDLSVFTHHHLVLCSFHAFIPPFHLLLRRNVTGTVAVSRSLRLGSSHFTMNLREPPRHESAWRQVSISAAFIHQGIPVYRRSSSHCNQSSKPP